MKENKFGAYFYIDSYGNVGVRVYGENSIDEMFYQCDNMFNSRKEAEFELEKRKVIAQLKAWKKENDDYIFTLKKENYYIVCDVEYQRLIIDCASLGQVTAGYLYFSSEAKAEECLHLIGEEQWRTYLLEC